jgi:hypothetical protein
MTTEMMHEFVLATYGAIANVLHWFKPLCSHSEPTLAVCCFLLWYRQQPRIEDIRHGWYADPVEKAG